MLWRTIAPIKPEYRNRGGLGVVYDLGFGVSLGPVGSWPFDQTVLPSLGNVYRREVEDSELWLVAEYEADSFGDPSEFTGVTRQELAMRRLREAMLALWIPKPSSLSFRVAIHHFEREGEWLSQGWEAPCLTFLALDRYHEARLVRADMESASDLMASISTLPHEGPVWIACRSAFGALQETDPPLRFLLHWIAIEALFGAPSRSRGVGDVITSRAAAFLQNEAESRRDIGRTLSRSYRHRHAVSHGMAMAGLPRGEELILPAEGAVRGALHKILSDRELVRTFNSESREAYLDGLARGTRSPA